MLSARGRCAIWFVSVSSLVAGSVAAQAPADEQVIEDPELAAPSGATRTGPVEPAAETGAATPQFVSQARLRLHTRLGMDIHRNDPREEIAENTSVATLELSVRRSETLRFVAGMRARHHVGWLDADVPDERAERIDLDATPTAGYVDIKLAEGLALQLGYQSVRLGRFDLVSAVDVLSAADFRDGPATLPDAAEVAQPAVRLDVDVTSSIAVRILYVPFFTPHILSVYDSDYALLQLTEAQVETGIAVLGLDSRSLYANLSRADRERLAQSGFAAFAPEANLASQQAALRATLRGSSGELSLTAATAIEHMPALYFTQEAIDYLADPSDADRQTRIRSVPRPIQIAYDRFALVAVDATLDLAPFSAGVEATYMFHRTLQSAGSGSYPDTLPLPDTSDVAQLGLRLEYLSGVDFVFMVEAFGAYSLNAPRAPNRRWMFLEDGRYIAGAASAIAWSLDFGLRLSAGVVALTGGTVLFAPRVGYVLIDTLELELGAIVVEGPPPPATLTPDIAVGTLYDATDQVFVGLGYTL